MIYLYGQNGCGLMVIQVHEVGAVCMGIGTKVGNNLKLSEPDQKTKFQQRTSVGRVKEDRRSETSS
jgi:hypothetical protein